MNHSAKTITLFSEPFLDTYNQCYKNIVTVNLLPQGPLSNFVRRINFPPLSKFKQPGLCSRVKMCGLALVSLENNDFGYNYNGCCRASNCSKLMVVDEIPNLFSFLLSNGYTIDTSITKMLNNSDIRFQTNNSNNIICLITYNG